MFFGLIANYCIFVNLWIDIIKADRVSLTLETVVVNVLIFLGQIKNVFFYAIDYV